MECCKIIKKKSHNVTLICINNVKCRLYNTLKNAFGRHDRKIRSFWFMVRKCSTLRITTIWYFVKSCQSYFTLCNRNLIKKPYSKPFCTFDNHDFRLKLITRPFKIAVIMEHTENIPLIIVYELLSKINQNVCNAFFYPLSKLGKFTTFAYHWTCNYRGQLYTTWLSTYLMQLFNKQQRQLYVRWFVIALIRDMLTILALKGNHSMKKVLGCWV